MGPIGSALAAAARVVLAGALVWSSVAKLVSWRALPAELRAFGVPDAFVAGVAIALPVAELAVAVMLVAWWGAALPGWVAVALLAVFTGFLVRASARGAPCPCFGVAHEGSSGAAGVARNGVLIALAVLATGDPGGAHTSGVLVLVLLLGAATIAAVLLSAGGGRAGRVPTQPG